MPGAPTRGQRQTAAARARFLDGFPDPAARSEHFRELGRLAAERRVVLSGDEASALSQAYRLLSDIAARLPRPDGDGDPLPVPPGNGEAAGCDPAASGGR